MFNVDFICAIYLCVYVCEFKKMKELKIFPSFLREYAIVFTVNLSVMTTGMSAGWPSPMLVKLSDPKQTPLTRPITAEEGSWIVSLGFLISIFSNILLGYLMDVIGRKNTICLATLPKLCGCVLVLFGKEVWMLILGRTLVLIADNMVLVIVPVYASEIASKERRGALGSFVQIFCSIGIVIAFSVGPFVSFYTYNVILTSAIAVTSLALFLLPDSPSSQYSKGKIAEATKTLTFLRGSEQAAQTDIEEYSKTNSKNNTEIELRALLCNKLFIKSFSIAFLIAGGSQIIGFNAVSYYIQTILESTNTNVRSEISSVIIGVIQLASSLCTTPICDRFGRRPVIITSLAGTLVGLVGLGVFFQVSQTPGYIVHGFMNHLPTVSLIIIVYCFSVGIGSLVWVVPTELFDGATRAYGVSMAMSLMALVLFLSIKYFAALTLTLGAATTYWLLSFNCTIVLILIFLFVPETKKKTFEEIQKDLKDRSFYFRPDKVEKEICVNV